MGSWLLPGALAAVACQDPRTGASAPRDPAPDSSKEPIAEKASANSSPDATATEPARPSARLPLSKGDQTFAGYPRGLEWPRRLAFTGAPRGVLVVWSRPDPAADASDVLAVLLDDRGLVRGAPRLVQRTRGLILDIAVDRRDGAAWIAWTALLAGTPGPHVDVTAIEVEVDLSGVHPPISIDRFTTLTWPDAPMIRVRDLASGHAAVAAPAAVVDCTDPLAALGAPCSGFALTWVHADGTTIRAGHAGSPGFDPGAGSLIDLGAGVLFDSWAWHRQPTFSTMYAPYDGSLAAPPVDIVHCRPPFSRMWSGSQLATLCEYERAEPGQRCKHNAYTEDEGKCHRIHVVDRNNRRVTPPTPLLAPMRRYLEYCQGGDVVVELRWSGGGLVVDPRRPGASLHYFVGAWTGRHAIDVYPDGERERWVCMGKDFGLDDHLDDLEDPFPLDPRDPAPIPALP